MTLITELRQPSLEAVIESFIPTGISEVNEEQLFIAIISEELEKKKKGLGQEFFSQIKKLSSIPNAKGAEHVMPELEDLAMTVMTEFLKSKKLSASDKTKIINTAWTAAQLDSSPELWDSIGGKNDTTIAKMNKSIAISSAYEALKEIKLGTKTLIDPNKIQADKKVSYKNKLNASPDNFDFLWKPVASSSGTAAVLIPSDLAKQSQTIQLISTDNQIVDVGRFTSFGDNGAYGKYVFSKAGSDYSAMLSVVITLQSGEKVTFKLADPSKRTLSNRQSAVSLEPQAPL